MFTLANVLNAIGLVGSNAPAFKALFDQVVATFGEDDQAVLQESYAKAMAASDAQHEAAQNL
jgi:hypothetical protein